MLKEGNVNNEMLGPDGNPMKAHWVLPILRKAIWGYNINVSKIFKGHRNDLSIDHFLHAFDQESTARICPEHVTKDNLAACF